ncbi:hypothetical protein BN946_scf184801.g49 [Trametes cinnabarina]|uniref:Uncharacterized protein n=1 Tax=Pycnoporus cinnabarinus TaxID=5643 RepID=A0A060S9H1_PYCCI|nr:hypothetical protein BN946_scf184801.g49 [Trametes cinnabarina]
MAQPIIYSTPPLAGRPPFATDEPDSIYDQRQPEQTRRLRQQPPADPNARTSAYNVYDQYLDEKKENPFDDSKQVYPQPIPLAAPQPGYAAPVSALDLSRPAPAATPDGRQPASPEMSEFGHGPVSQAGSIPSTPHPLQPPMVPIAPVFARPSTATSRDVKFVAQPIMRGDTEDTVLPRRGQRGDDFWRRFSMVAREDMSTGPGQKQSWWLRKTQSGTTRMSRWVWVIGLTLLIIIAGAIGLGWYVSHNSTTHSAPTAIGGSANEKAIDSETPTSTAVAGALATSTVLHVTPTKTVARRADEPIPTPMAIYPVTARGSSAHRVHVVQAHRHGRRTHLNRTTH